VKPFLSLECEKLELHVFDTQIVHLKNLTRKVTLPHAKTVFIHETFTTQENLYSDSSNSAKAPTLRHRPPLYSWREALPPPSHCGGKTAKYKLNLQSTSTVKRSNKQQSKINSNHQLSCLHKLEKFYTITNTSLKVCQNVLLTLETLSTKTTGKVSDV